MQPLCWAVLQVAVQVFVPSVLLTVQRNSAGGVGVGGGVGGGVGVGVGPPDAAIASFGAITD
jgi:hypothetical protein